MSEHRQNDKTTVSAESSQKDVSKPKASWGFQKVLLVLAIGILIGSLFTRPVIDYLLSHLSILMAIFIALFLFIVIAVLALPRIINHLAKRYTGQDVNVEAAAGDIQAKANHIADTITGYALAKADPEVRKNIRQDLPGILHYLVFSRLRNSGLRMLMTVFVAIGGLMGTILLYNQNELLSGQNQMLFSQNDLLLKQNEKIDNQILLDEAARRSSLNFLLGNVLDQVNQELSDPENTKRQLSRQLIGRISSLSQSFQPYNFMDDGKMIERPLSPERGALLLALVNSGIDTLTLNTIFAKTTFQYAYLKDANLKSIYLRGIDLHGADLRKADISFSDLSMANLSKTNLSEADLSWAKLIGGERFLEEDLDQNQYSSFARSFMQQVERMIIRSESLKSANLTKANLHLSDLTRADLTEAIGINLDMLKSSHSLYEIVGLPDSLADMLKTAIKNEPMPHYYYDVHH